MNAIAALLDTHGADGFAAAWLRHRGLGWAAELIAADTLHSPQPLDLEILA